MSALSDEVQVSYISDPHKDPPWQPKIAGQPLVQVQIRPILW
jgi:hypothetical protein